MHHYLLTVLLMWFLFIPSSSAQEKGHQVYDGVSMDFQDAELKDVLKIFSQQSGLNFIAGEEIKTKRVTLYLDKVSVEDALFNIMNANQLVYDKKEGSDIFVVKQALPVPPPPEPTVETITKVYVLKYAQIGGAEGSSSDASSSGASTVSGGTTAGSITQVIESLLSEHGKLVSEKRTNSLIVTDISEKFPLIEKIIRELDVPASQVAIEAEILETVGNTLNRIGIEYGGTNGEIATVTPGKRETRFPFPHRLTGTADTTYTMGTLDASSFKFALELLFKDSRTKVLARPRVMTMNNETAEIKITAETAVASVATITAAQGGVSQSTTQAERMETGVILRVTPQINEERVVTLTVEPEVIRPEDSKFFSGKFVDPLRRKIKTTVMLKDNETLILGGLIETQSSDVKRKIPLLGDIPLAGALFTKKTGDTTERELVVFITPHVLVPGERPSTVKTPATTSLKTGEKQQKVKEDLEALELIQSLKE